MGQFKSRMTTCSYTLSEERNGVEGRASSSKLREGGEGGKRSGQENKITARGALAKDFDCIREVLNFFAVQKVAPLTS